jgi:hypothetical protein
VSLRPGDKTHDAEFFKDPDLFLTTCTERYGPVFNLYLYNQFLTIISGPLAREVFMTDDLNFGDALDDTTGMHSFTTSMTKSKRTFDDPAIHEMIRDIVNPNLALFTPRIVGCMSMIADKEFEIGDRKFIADPQPIFQDMVATASKAYQVVSAKLLSAYYDNPHDLNTSPTPSPSAFALVLFY